MKKRIILIDASSLSNSGCLRKFYLANVEGYRPRGLANDVSVEYGSAFHVFKQVIKQYHSMPLALGCAQKYFTSTPMTVPTKKAWLDIGHLTKTCLDYCENQSDNNYDSLTDKNGNPLVEQTFSIPYYTNDNVDVILQGTIDDIGKIRGGCYLLEDVKTTSSWNQVEYLSQYELSHQLMFYKYALDWMGQNKPGTIYEEIYKTKLGCAIYGVFLSASKPTEFKRSDVFLFSDRQMSKFKLMLDKFISSLITNTGMPLPSGIITGDCNKVFKNYDSKCPYWKVCSSPDDIAEAHRLNGCFEKSEYRPLGFRSLTPEIEYMIKKWKDNK